MSRSNEHYRGPMNHSIFTGNHIIVDDFVQLQAICDAVRNLRTSSVNQRKIESVFPVWPHEECSLRYNCHSGNWLGFLPAFYHLSMVLVNLDQQMEKISRSQRWLNSKLNMNQDLIIIVTLRAGL